MSFVTNEVPTSARLNALVVQIQEAASSGNLTLSTSLQDVPSATITVTTALANAKYEVIAFIDMECTAFTAADIAIALLNVDSSDVTSPTAHFKMQAANDRATVGQVWTGTFTAAGSHTVKLRGKRNSTGGTMRINATNTKLTIKIFEQP